MCPNAKKPAFGHLQAIDLAVFPLINSTYNPSERTTDPFFSNLLGSAKDVSQKQRFELINETRRTLTQILIGIFGLIALFLTWRRVRATDRMTYVAEQSHITERFTKAIEQLGAMTSEGSHNIEVRLGGIYALERIAFDSPRDHWAIMEVLTAYVRHNSPSTREMVNPDSTLGGPPTDIQAILTVLGRRTITPEREGNRR